MLTFQDLPKTAYLKLIDVWLLFTLVFLVAIMAFHTYLCRVILKEPKEQIRSGHPSGRNNHQKTAVEVRERAAGANFVGKMAFALTLVAFNVTYWAVAISTYVGSGEKA